METILTLPPPRDSPVTATLEPSALCMVTVTVLGCMPAPSSLGRNENSIPASRARSKESRTRTSSGASPRIPATSARSLPWPL